MKGCKVKGVFVPKCSQKHTKDRKLKDFHFQAFVKKVNHLAGEYNGSKYHLIALALL